MYCFSPTRQRAAVSILLAGALSACGPTDKPSSQHNTDTTGGVFAPADEFLANIAQYCGKAFAGRITANQPVSDQPDPFAGKALVMHVRGCENPARELRIPFHVGDDHSRTWILTRTVKGLRLKHDHRHEDGSEDAVTMYGGDSAQAGSEKRQEFPVDNESIATFKKEGLSSSLENTWAMEIHPGEKFIYELTRPGGREFRVQFDLSKPVELPVTPWGY